MVFEGCDVEGVLGIFKCPPTCSFGVSGDASTFGGMPVVDIFGVVIEDVPRVFFVGVEEFNCYPTVGWFVKEVIPSVWMIGFVCWCLKGDCAFNVCWEVVLLSAVDKSGFFC